MFSLVKKTLRRVISFATVLERLQTAESAIVRLQHKIERFDKIADENDALWKYLDEQPSPGEEYPHDVEPPIADLTDAMLRSMKTYGDA